MPTFENSCFFSFTYSNGLKKGHHWNLIYYYIPAHQNSGNGNGTIIHWKSIQSRVITWPPGIVWIFNVWWFCTYYPHVVSRVFWGQIDHYSLHSGRFDPNLVRWSIFATFSRHLDLRKQISIPVAILVNH